MPWEFSGENLVYNAPPETTGYTWKPMAQNENGTNPEGQWVQNEGFDPATLLNGRVDKYGRLDLTPKEDLNAAEQRAYQLAYGSVDPSKEQFEVKSIDPNFVKNNNAQWWNVDPAYQDWWIREHSQNKGGALGTGGGLIGMRPNEYIVPAAILAGGALAAYAAPAAGALGAATAPAYDAAFAFGAGAGNAGVGLTVPSLVSGLEVGTGGAFASAPAASGTLGGFGSIVSPSLAGGLEVGSGGVLGANALSAETVANMAALEPTTGWGLNASQVPNITGNLADLSIPTSTSITDALKTANQVKQGVSTANNLAKLLSPVAKTVAKTGTNANSQYINAAQNLAQFTPEQFGGYYQMNKNPFTFSNPMANALKNKDATGLDVSGTGGQALNTTNQIANLLRTLA